MKYKIIVDKQSKVNPSAEKREYEIDIEELHCRGKIYDSLVITKDEDYVMRRLQKNEYNVLNVLAEPIKEALPSLNIELFEGDNYIYLLDIVGNKLCAEYLIKNDFTDMYVTKNLMNSAINESANQIEMFVNQTLEGYSTTEEVQALLQILANQINLEIAKKINAEEITAAKIMLMINQDNTSGITLDADKIGLTANDVLNIIAGAILNLSARDMSITSNNFKVDKYGNITATGGVIGGFSLGEKKFNSDIYGIYKYNLYDARNIIAMYYGKISKPNGSYSIYDINDNGSINLVDAQTAVLINNGQQSSSKNVSGKFEINSDDPKNFIKILNDSNLSVSIGVGGINTQLLCAENIVCSDQETEVSIALNGSEGTVSAKNVKVKDFNVPEILHGNVFITPSAANTPTRKGGNIRENI